MKTYTLIRTNQFDENLRALISYIKSENPVNASVFLEGVFEAIDAIALFPEKGMEIGPRIRLKLYKGYWVPYHIDGLNIYILDILHPRQNTKARTYCFPLN